MTRKPFAPGESSTPGPTIDSEIQRLRAAYQARTANTRIRERYDLSNAGNELNYLERENVQSELIAHHFPGLLTGVSILDLGCGWGELVDELCPLRAVPELFWGVDLMEDRVAIAQKLHPQAHFVASSAHQLPFNDRSFELVHQGMLMSSVLDRHLAEAIAREIDRVLKPGGKLLWFDCRINPTNPDARGIGKRKLMQLFPGYSVDARLISLAPPIARFVAPRSRMACRFLASIRGLRTHYLAMLTKP